MHYNLILPLTAFTVLRLSLNDFQNKPNTIPSQQHTLTIFDSLMH